jgi:hypothetical protein
MDCPYCDNPQWGEAPIRVSNGVGEEAMVLFAPAYLAHSCQGIRAWVYGNAFGIVVGLPSHLTYRVLEATATGGHAA